MQRMRHKTLELSLGSRAYRTIKTDGPDIVRAKTELIQIQNQREELERERKRIKRRKSEEENEYAQEERLCEISLQLSYFRKREMEKRAIVDDLLHSKQAFLKESDVLELEKTDQMVAQASAGKFKSMKSGRYIILGLAGKGSKSTVYRGYDLELNKNVAIKLSNGDYAS